MAFEPLFPIANIFSWIGIDFIQETDYKKPNPTKISLIGYGGFVGRLVGCLVGESRGFDWLVS